MAASPDPLPAWPDRRSRDGEDEVASLPDGLPTVAAETERLVAELGRALEVGRTQRLQRDDFLSYAAHELRTPLTLILGYSQAIARRMQDRPEAARDLDDLERVIASTRRLSGMVDEMLEVSRVESGRLKVSLRPFSLRSAAQEAVSRAPSGRFVVLEGDPGLPDAVGDEAKVGRAIWILLQNALLVTPADLPVRIALGASRQVVAATVEDQGPIIPEEALTKLFDLPYVYPGAVDNRYGLGLGLFVARGIARAIGGDVRFERPEDGAPRGSRFVLTVPRASPEPFPLGPE